MANIHKFDPTREWLFILKAIVLLNLCIAIGYVAVSVFHVQLIRAAVPLVILFGVGVHWLYWLEKRRVKAAEMAKHEEVKQQELDRLHATSDMPPATRDEKAEAERARLEAERAELEARKRELEELERRRAAALAAAGAGAERTHDGASLPKGGEAPQEISPEEAWERMQTMEHNLIPDFVVDAEYLYYVNVAAQGGNLNAIAKLGEYAMRRGTIVEAFYWTFLADMYGHPEVATPLRNIRSLWMRSGCPGEEDNVRPDFTETQGEFARAVLAVQCGLDAPLARRTIEGLAAAGCREAEVLLGGWEKEGM